MMTIRGEIKRTTEKAVLLTIECFRANGDDATVDVWFPKSHTAPVDGGIEASDWIASQKLADLRARGLQLAPVADLADTVEAPEVGDKVTFTMATDAGRQSFDGRVSQIDARNREARVEFALNGNGTFRFVSYLNITEIRKES